MRGTKSVFTLIAVFLALVLITGLAFAAQGGRAGRGNRAAREGDAETPAATTAAESTEQTEGEAAEGAESTKPAAETSETEKPAVETPKATPEELNSLLEKRLKALQAALEKITSNGGGKIPTNFDLITKSLPNRKRDAVNPETEKPLVMNMEMAGKFEDAITKPKEFITFYADAPTPNKGRAVIFADSTIKYLNEEEFKKALAASKPRELSREEQLEKNEARNMGKAR